MTCTKKAEEPDSGFTTSPSNPIAKVDLVVSVLTQPLYFLTASPTLDRSLT